MNEEKIIEKLSEHDRRFDEHDKRFDEHDRRFDEVDKTMDVLAIRILENREEIIKIRKEMATKKDINDINNTLDIILKQLIKMEQENVFGGKRLGRAEKQLEKHEKEIADIKIQLQTG
ncbi:MAG: hypothetical protein GF349_03390 [Candidatus Magasanikbacteria bacterium]|nr:hypothetical protein [Candidatus Magasanikbacteria bacterium]